MSKPREVPIAVDAIAGRPLFHTVCRDCCFEVVHPATPHGASAERTHRNEHPDHRVATTEVSGDE